jgi:hypothetical protein
LGSAFLSDQGIRQVFPARRHAGRTSPLEFPNGVNGFLPDHALKAIETQTTAYAAKRLMPMADVF